MIANPIPYALWSAAGLWKQYEEREYLKDGIELDISLTIYQNLIK